MWPGRRASPFNADKGVGCTAFPYPERAHPPANPDVRAVREARTKRERHAPNGEATILSLQSNKGDHQRMTSTHHHAPKADNGTA